ncbi:predicted protein [Naegleria gruberi]|uniref:Predicted protein n=1 Tax=Naegleria gruberi TaxID=5762 RepID=D2VW72_NAEGR|nr:uncharacterized protein NAEGRDRAFT_73279 [Naegleria gruberi]EFC39029.1 predicted protein [Naegleria gruberi]|eukprot:XP_002671773.1 predicted protein [Naegleria gruberi strain NEG-M]
MSNISRVIFGFYISIICLATIFFPILNMVIVVLLIRKLILNQKFPVTDQRRKSCRKMLLLTFGQLYMALLNLISMSFGGFAFAYYIPLYPICLFIHKISLLLFCIIVTFSFGPLDFVLIEFNSASSQSVTSVEIIQKRDDISQSALNSDQIIRKEDFREYVNSETKSNTSGIPILVDQSEIFTEIPLWDKISIFSLSKPQESAISQL